MVRILTISGMPLATLQGMTDQLRVILEIGKKRRIVAGAMDWPGLDRWGTSEEDALTKLESYLPRYAGVAERAGLSSAFKRHGPMTVVERVPGSSSTDFWGIAHVPSEIERDVLSSKNLERRLALLQAAWDDFHDTSTRVSEELRLGPRGGGRTRDEIVRHVYASERHNFWRKVGIRHEDGVRLTPDELAALRRGVRRHDPGLQRREQAGALLADPVPHPSHRATRDGPRVGDG